MNAAKTNQKGFSIIEVVLVLAIAGLIFLMVFVALPALQRNQRDQARRSDVGIVGSAVSSYASNNRGKLPTNVTDLRKYVKDLSQYDADSDLVLRTGTAGTPDEDEILVNIGAKCADDSSSAPVAGTSRSATVRVVLEGTDLPFCQNV